MPTCSRGLPEKLHTGRQTYRETGIQIDRHRQTCRQTYIDRQTDRDIQAGRQTYRQTDIEADRHRQT